MKLTKLKEMIDKAVERNPQLAELEVMQRTAAGDQPLEILQVKTRAMTEGIVLVVTKEAEVK